MLVLLYFAMHYAPNPSNTLFGSMRGMDGNIHFQLQGQTSLFSEKNTPECGAHILGGDERTLKIIMSTAVLEGRTAQSLGSLIFSLEMQHRIQISSCLPMKRNGFTP